jgi:hypothetical protein
MEQRFITEEAFRCALFMNSMNFWMRSLGSSVNTVIGCGLESVQTKSEANPNSYPLGTRSLFLGVKKQECESDHSFPSSAEVKNGISAQCLPN